MIINSNGVSYAVEVIGDGPPLLLLHGFTGAGTNWTPFVPTWCNEYKLVMVDILGHGCTDSPADANRYSMLKVVKDLYNITHHLSIDRISILGYSMGGRLALSFAVTYPEKVDTLILESSSPGLKTETERMARNENDTKLANKIVAEGVPAFVDFWENIPLFQTQKRLSASIKQDIRSGRLDNNAIGLANSLIGMGTGKQPSWWDHLRTLSFPVLLICGAEDRKFCLIADEMAGRIPHCTVQIVPDSGHTVHVEQPVAFEKIIKEYLHKIHKNTY